VIKHHIPPEATTLLLQHIKAVTLNLVKRPAIFQLNKIIAHHSPTMSSSKSESLYSVSTIQSIKKKFSSAKSSSPSKQPKHQASPGEKQAERKITRTDPQTVAAWALMR
jgi:hypothetical protein